MLLAHKIRLKPNKVQATYFARVARAAGTARFSYNWTLAEWGKQYDAWKLENTRPRLYQAYKPHNTLPKPSHFSLSRALNAIKKQQFPWMLQVSKSAPNWALDEWSRQYQAWKRDNTPPKPSQMSWRRALNALKREQFPWMMEVEQVRA